MALYQWSTTPASNATAGSINWAEGQAPSTVNDSARQLMADVATYMVDPQFYNFGDTPTYVSATQFTVPGNQTAHYAVNRRIKASVTAGTIYGSISVSAYTTLTTVTVVWDSGSLDAGLSAVYLAIVTDKVQSAVSATTATSATSATTATTATTATNIAGGASGSLPYQSGAGATALLAKGTDGQVLTLASGIPAWTASPIGVGQTAQNMLGVGGRAWGAAITNSTGRPIFVSIRSIINTSQSSLTLTIDGVVFVGSENSGGGGYASVSAIVPNGSTYTLGATGTGSSGTISHWSELR